MVVFGLGKKLLFKSVLGRCVYVQCYLGTLGIAVKNHMSLYLYPTFFVVVIILKVHNFKYVYSENPEFRYSAIKLNSLTTLY